MCSSPADRQGHERNDMAYDCPRGHEPRQASARTCCESPRPRATQRHEGDDEETNPAIITGNGALYGRKQDQRPWPQVWLSQPIRERAGDAIRCIQRYRGEMNPAITTGTAPYMGGSRTRGHHHGFYHSNLYRSGQAMLYHVHSGTAGIDEWARNIVL